jgi:hypothetical protein
VSPEPGSRRRLDGAEGPASPVPERGGIEEKVARLEELRRQVEACTDLEQAIELLTQVEAAAKELLEAVDQEKREADARG